MHPSAFEYLKPTDDQMVNMHRMRAAFAEMAVNVMAFVPEGPDRDHVFRLLRAAGMWANVAITREADGSPRD